jgi:hypothetical protein
VAAPRPRAVTHGKRKPAIAPMAREAFSKNRTVEAERFVVRNEGGIVRAVVGGGIDGSPRGQSV